MLEIGQSAANPLLERHVHRLERKLVEAKQSRNGKHLNPL